MDIFFTPDRLLTPRATHAHSTLRTPPYARREEALTKYGSTHGAGAHSVMGTASGAHRGARPGLGDRRTSRLFSRRLFSRSSSHILSRISSALPRSQASASSFSSKRLSALEGD